MRLAAVRLAGVRLAAVRLTGVRLAGAGREGASLRTSSAATRRASPSISERRPFTSSRIRSSSIVSRMREAAAATSSTRLRVRLDVVAAPSVVAWNVRSTALRTASTASAASEPFCLSFFFLSFLAIAQLYSQPLVPILRPHEEVAERVLLPGDPGRALRLAQQLLDVAEDAQPQPRAVGLHGRSPPTARR